MEIDNNPANCVYCGNLSHVDKVLENQCRLMTAIIGKNWGVKQEKQYILKKWLEDQSVCNSSVNVQRDRFEKPVVTVPGQHEFITKHVDRDVDWLNFEPKVVISAENSETLEKRCDHSQNLHINDLNLSSEIHCRLKSIMQRSSEVVKDFRNQYGASNISSNLEVSIKVHVCSCLNNLNPVKDEVDQIIEDQNTNEDEESEDLDSFYTASSGNEI